MAEAGKQFDVLVGGGKAASGISKSDFATLLKNFSESPEVLSRLGSSALKNKQLSAAYSKLFDLLGEKKALSVLEYFGREGATVVDELPAVLKAIESKGVKDVDEIGEILTDSRLRKQCAVILLEGNDLVNLRNPPPMAVVMG